LLSLLAVQSGVIGFCAVHLVPWWSTAIPGGLLVIFVVVARISVWMMRKDLDARYREINDGSAESTIFLSRKDFPAEARRPKAKSESSNPGALWDPIPITMPTYVSKPLAPRTVRTIDLSGPGVASTARHDGPVTADAPSSAPDSSSATRGEETRKSASA
jgi:hypothetical protein